MEKLIDFAEIINRRRPPIPRRKLWGFKFFRPVPNRVSTKSRSLVWTPEEVSFPTPRRLTKRAA